jgi:hypothetical protein
MSNALAVAVPSVEIQSQPDSNIIPLSSFIADFGDDLLRAVSKQNPPIYDGVHCTERSVLLNQLRRKPFPAQQDVVQAVTRLLIDENQKTAIINGEMGVGKTLLGIATAAVLHAEGFPRTLILSPPHLVYKWRREILETIEGAKVWILNGPDTLMKLLQLRARCKAKDKDSDQPEFFILGRVRLRMGFHWQPAFTVRKKHTCERFNDVNDQPQRYISTLTLASCSHCGAIVKDSNGDEISARSFPSDKMYYCAKCHLPLWTLIRPHDQSNQRETIKQTLCQLPTIGDKRAEKLLTQFGDDFIADMLGDNIHQFINLMDDNGDLIFSDRQAQRMEKSLAKMELAFGQGGYQASEFIKRYLPKDFFSLLLIDEGHEFKGVSSAQGQAMGVIASQVKKIVLLTGTLMGGYGDDLFYLLWRTMPNKMIEDGYCYRRNSLNSASLTFMEDHGVLKTIRKVRDVDNHRTARGKKSDVRTSKAPGFGPKGIARYVLPFTAFLKLTDINADILPPYQEHFINVAMDPIQHERYVELESKLTIALRQALFHGDNALLGVVLNCLLAWPDCCFRPENVVHPYTKETLAFVPTIFSDEEISPKEQEMIDRCLQAKQNGQRMLVYTIYTGTRDTAARLKYFLECAGLKTAVLRSTVATDKREDWIADQIDNGIDVLVCNPELVKTGLDLLGFPNILFMQSGYNVYTLMQASRRSWRIGQTQPVNVFFLGYQHTAQIACLSLMAKKIAVSQSTCGTMPETGLDVLNQSGDSIEVALAKQLVGQ